MRQRPVTFRQAEGATLVVVPLGRNGSKGEAIVDLADWAMLLELGLSGNWNRSDAGYVIASCSRANGGSVVVARVLLDCSPGQTVSYCDGDRTNLRRSNIQLVKGGWSIRRDRDYLNAF